MDQFSCVQGDLRHQNIVNVKNYKDKRMLKILEDIFEYSIYKNGFYLDKFPIYSDLNIITKNKKDIVFYISKNKNELFGISCIKINNDYLHIDPINWKKIAQNKKDILLEVNINNINQKIMFKETSSIEELNRINNLFNSQIK